jgi:mRNA-degrading endonuclease toxin of MazEF toxin-antitoxin module
MRGFVCYENMQCPTRPDILTSGRPVVIVSARPDRSVVQVVPFTSNLKKSADGDPMHIPVEINGIPSIALCEQLRTVRWSELRIGNLIGHCTAEEMSAIDRAITTLLGLQ